MSDLERLLAVQQHDTLADQLRHRRANLPERAELVEANQDSEAAKREIASASAQREALAAAQDRIEADITKAREHVKAVEAKLYGGAVSNPRELQALQDEIASLQRRIGLLEDEELGIMEKMEPIEAAIADQAVRTERLTGEIERLEDAITTTEAELDVEMSANEHERVESVEGLPADLLEEYDRIRSTSGGIAVAALTAGQCGGCHIRLSSMELDRVKKQPDSAVIHCEECGRLLVR